MNVMVVDDQVDIVKGLLIGIDWNKLDVDNVFKAYNIIQAKKIFSENQIHVLLCDIEMPMGSGLELLEWIRENYPETECIFLTSHAEFKYAQEAVKLGSFDFILQPARYDEIQQVVKKALDKVRQDMQTKQLYKYGKYWHDESQLILDGFFIQFLLGNKVDNDKVINHLQTLNVGIKENTMLSPVLINLLGTSEKRAHFEPNALKADMENVLKEIMAPGDELPIMIQLDKNNFLALIIDANKNKQDYMKESLAAFVDSCEEKLKCTIACYIGSYVQVLELPKEIELLYKLEQNNVALKNGVFKKNDSSELKGSTYANSNMKRWSKLLVQGYTQIVRDEAIRFIKIQAEQEKLNAAILEIFYQDFLQMMLGTGILSNAYDFFSESKNENDYMHAYTSVTKMISFIDYALNYVEKETAGNTTQSTIEKIVDYIHDNIEKNITRKDIAEHVFLSPEYLSRLFHKEKGIMLKDFIIGEKIKIAQHLLAETNIPISIIGSKVGYTNFSHFSQIFKRKTDDSPAEYRKKHKKQ